MSPTIPTLLFSQNADTVQSCRECCVHQGRCLRAISGKWNRLSVGVAGANGQTVVAAKDFHGMEESSYLSRAFSDQGVRLRLRKEPMIDRFVSRRLLRLWVQISDRRITAHIGADCQSTAHHSPPKVSGSPELVRTDTAE